MAKRTLTLRFRHVMHPFECQGIPPIVASADLRLSSHSQSSGLSPSHGTLLVQRAGDRIGGGLKGLV
jgi:hypothetical protein